MNARSLTRGDAAVGGAAVLLFIFSFLPYYETKSILGGGSVSANAWHADLFPLLPSVYLLGIAAGALIVCGHALPQVKDKAIAGMKLDQWGIPLAFASFWTALWTQFASLGPNHAFGSYLTLLVALILFGAAVATPLVPALAAPLVTDRPQQPVGPGQPYPQPGMGQPQPGWGGQPQPGPQQGQPYPPQQQGQPGPQQGQGYGYPAPQQGGPAPVATHQGPGPQAQPQPQDPAFSPFWFAVPEPRPLMPENGAPGAPVAQLQPGVWHLALEQRGTALLVEEQVGAKQRGLLVDTNGIQRG